MSGLYSNAFSSGEAGRLAVATPLLTMDNSLIQAVAAADSRGNAGGLDVHGAAHAHRRRPRLTAARGPGARGVAGS